MKGRFPAGPRTAAASATMTNRRYWALFVAVLAVALAVRVGYVLATPGYTPTHDDRAYDYLALGIAKTGVFPTIGRYPTAYRPPAYPYFLGLIYAVSGSGHDRIVAARLVQAVLGTGVVALLGCLALRIYGRTTALCTATIAAVYVPFIAVGASLLSEPQSVALELAAILAVLGWRRDQRWRWVILAGLFGGLLTLTRSNAFVVLVALAAGLVSPSARRWGAALVRILVMMSVAMAVVAPWTIRNAVVMHSFIPVSDEAGGTLAGTYNPVSAHDGAAPGYWHLLAQIPTYRQATSSLMDGPEPPLQRRLLHLAVSYATQHPSYVARVAFYNTLRLLDLGGMSGARYTSKLAGITSASVADAGIYCFWLVFAAAAVGLAVGDCRRRVPGFVWLAAALLFVSITLVNSETPRLRVPLDPFVILMAGAAAGWVVQYLRPRRICLRHQPPGAYTADASAQAV